MVKFSPTEGKHFLTLTHLISTTDRAEGHNGFKATGTWVSTRGRLQGFIL